MLQQTRVDTVIDYFERWMSRFPTLHELAAAELEEVLKAWEGLGYYRRARSLHEAARRVVESGGMLPSSADELRTLPGIGPYTAGAIASIAFGQRTPAVDGNAVRVAARIFDLRSPSTREVVRLLEPVVAEGDRPGDLNQAIMELGATVCLPRSPRCGECPVAGQCEAFGSGVQEERPVRPRRKKPRSASFGVAVVVREVGPEGPLVGVVRRPRDVMLGGMWEFPGLEIPDHEEAEEVARRAAAERGLTVREGAEELPPVDHLYSHLRARYRPWLMWGGPAGDGEANGVRWVTLDQLHELPLPKAQQLMAALVGDRRWA
jgi:A/G-specific adenine glycosylase